MFGHNVEVRKLTLINFFLNLFFLSPVSVFFFQQRGLNYFEILALESVLVFFIFMFEVPTGIFADKFGRKKSIIIGTILIALEPLIFLFADNYILFAVAFALSGVGLAFLSGTIEAFIYDSLEKKNKDRMMKKAMGSYYSASLIALVVAPIIGSYLARDLLNSQFTLVILMTFGAMFLGAILTLFLKDTQKKKVRKENAIKIFKDGLNTIKTNKTLMRIILLSILSEPFLYSLLYLYQPYLKESRVDVAALGLIFAAALLLSALFQKYAYKFEEVLSVRWIVFCATVVPGILYLLMAFIFSPLWSIILFILINIVIGFRSPLFSAYKNLHIPSKNRATVLSIISMSISLYLVIMRLIIGKLADYKLSYAFIFMGAVVILGSLLFGINETHVKKKNIKRN